jgi:hypothetical protein
MKDSQNFEIRETTLVSARGFLAFVHKKKIYCGSLKGVKIK